MAVVWFLLYLVLAVAAFGAGFAAFPVWTIAPGPVVSAVLGIHAVATEPANYDMAGFGYYLGAFGAAVCVIGWLAGRAGASLIGRLRGQRREGNGSRSAERVGELGEERQIGM